MTSRQIKLVENYIRNSVRKVLKEEKNKLDLTKISTDLLKQMMDILGKNYNEKTPDEKELLHSIQREWAMRKDK